MALRLGTSLLLAVAAGGVQAQERGTVRGTVVVGEGAGEPVPYAVVALLPGHAQRFTDDSGRFEFPEVAPGSYRLFVRQIGFFAYDTLLTISDSGDVRLRVALRKILVELPAVTIAAQAECNAPGAPDPDLQPELAVIFEQVRENAVRYRLLADAYPYRYWLERWIRLERRRDRTEVERHDTLEEHSWGRWRYRPGNLVTLEESRGWRRDRVMNIPTLADLADSVFHATHCFYFGGVEPLEGQGYFRVDFLVARRVRTPDVDGTALLDTTTFQLRRLRLRLTRPERVASGIGDLEAWVDFAEIVPAVLVPGQVRATTVMTPAAARRSGELRRLEEQRLLKVEFQGPGLPRGRPAP